MGHSLTRLVELLFTGKRLRFLARGSRVYGVNDDLALLTNANAFGAHSRHIPVSYTHLTLPTIYSV